MDELKIKSYTPDTSSYAPRIRTEQWDQHKSLLKHLHDEGYKRAAMLDILRKQGFTPSMGQLNAKMTAWGFKVYGTQSETQEHEASSSTRGLPFDFPEDQMIEQVDSKSTLSPSPRRSISSITLCEPERQIGVVASDRHLSLDEVIIVQSLASIDTYWPATKPSDFGFKTLDLTSDVSESYHQSIILVADFLCAVHCFEQAFDLYYHVLEQLVVNHVSHDTTLLRTVVQCAISATTDAQCAHALSIVRRVHSWCVEHMMVELTACFSALSQDLCTKDVNEGGRSNQSLYTRLSDVPLLMAMDPGARSVAYKREWLHQQLAECDQTCSTLAHLSLWCQDTLSFYRLESQAITKPATLPDTGLRGAAALEYDFQMLVSALVIDYLNSPGPSMKRADVECKETGCLFRRTLSPSTSLIVMAHLLYEPLRLQYQPTTNKYLQSRAQQFATTRMTTALQELKAFASADSKIRCSAFVDTFMKHFNTNLTFRRCVANLNPGWDRMNAAKRMAQLLQSNQSGLLPHAGLPSARRSVLKTMVAPFPQDPSLTESRPSLISDSGSIGEFERLASQIGYDNAYPGSLTPSDAMSIDTRSSWSFHRVTGFGPAPMSGRSSLSARRGEPDEMEEYRHFIKDNNYNSQNMSNYSDAPTQRYPGPKRFP